MGSKNSKLRYRSIDSKDYDQKERFKRNEVQLGEVSLHIIFIRDPQGF